MTKKQLITLALVLGSILVAAIIVVAIIGTTLVLRPTVQLPAPTQESAPQADPTEPPTQVPTDVPTLIPTLMPTPTLPPTQPPAAAPATCSLLSISEFNQMWSSTIVDNPGPLMEALNTWFDTGGWQCGGQSSVGDWKVPSGTILWTDLLNQQFVAADGMALRNGDIVRLRCQGDWCVFAIYREVYCPTPGRYAILASPLDPANDLTGWSR